ncbi:acyltransferase [Rurimicrobium arvi]|uniref:Acyltransferase n=1 Tax=Rurimicrobium arvi TaxID=2049916 RepID=A0ABP8N2X2_9BACT
MKFKSLEIINSKDRISSVDIFRSIAIITVVLFHFNFSLPYGYLGVDLFFLISGLLVGGMLVRQLERNEPVHFGRFFLQRGFKIWPSYYVFLLLGNGIAWILYHNTHPEQIIPLWDLKRYVFFYQNYTGKPFHWSFDHVWSLCVEEHFYILLPLMFIVLQRFVALEHRKKMLLVFVILTIAAGMLFKYCSFFFTRSKDTYSATHNRIDALAWGVLLHMAVTRYKDRLRSATLQLPFFGLGVLLFVAALYTNINCGSVLFNRVYFHSIVPLCFFLMLLGLYYVDFSKWKALRFIAYYSYNWYLWHPLFVLFLTAQFGNTPIGLLCFISLTFLIAVIMTTAIEEPALRKRKAILDKLSGKPDRVGTQSAETPDQKDLSN